VSLQARARQELVWRKCLKDPVFWVENYWWIRHPEGRRLLELRDPQRTALENFATGENWLTLKARQIGWSTITTAYAYWRALQPDKRILLISKGEREATELLQMIKFGHERLPPWIQAHAPKLLNDNQTSMKFDNGSEITSLPSAANPGRGFSGSVVIVDEWAHILNDEEAWASIEPVADIGGQIIGLSTANGIGNWFHLNWEKAVRGENSFKTMFYSWRAVPERDDAWYERKQAEFLPWQLAQEYPNDPEEAFIKSGNVVFDGEALKRIVPTNVPVGNLFKFAPRAYEYRLGSGQMKVWEHPIESHVYVIGADVAEGLGHGDASAAHVIDVGESRVVAAWHGRYATDLFADELFAMGIYYYGCLLGVEANNHGHAVISDLRRLSYPKLFRRRSSPTSHQKALTPQYGWWTSKESKAVMIDDLARVIRTEELGIPDEETIRELKTFARDDRGKMGGQPFDDRVMSLAIANQLRQYAFLPEYLPVVDREGTLDWWAESVGAEKPAVMSIGGGNIRRRDASRR
jgi:hypothetical protein